MNLQGIFRSMMITILCSYQNTFIEDGYNDFSLFSVHHIFLFIIFLVVPIVGTCPIVWLSSISYARKPYLTSVAFLVFISSFILLWNYGKALNDIPSMMAFHSAIFFLTRAWSASTFAVTSSSCFIRSSGCEHW